MWTLPFTAAGDSVPWFAVDALVWIVSSRVDMTALAQPSGDSSTLEDFAKVRGLKQSTARPGGVPEPGSIVLKDEDVAEAARIRKVCIPTEEWIESEQTVVARFTGPLGCILTEKGVTGAIHM